MTQIRVATHCLRNPGLKYLFLDHKSLFIEFDNALGRFTLYSGKQKVMKPR